MTSQTLSLINRALRQIPPPPTQHQKIHLALSGGIDSTVSGLLLREAGYSVHPVLMRCWDGDVHETDVPTCHITDLHAAKRATTQLKLTTPLQIVDLVHEYWTQVFDRVLLSGLRDGDTPNADLACNRYIKFQAFRTAISKGSERRIGLATGHYARTRRDDQGRIQLLAGFDRRKDQSYFLASVRGCDLEGVIFPVGGLLKDEVREIGTMAGLDAIKSRSSRGLCFIGKRETSQFFGRYLQQQGDGRFIDAESGRVIGGLRGAAWMYTTGQRARVGGMEEAYYVLGRVGGDVAVVKGWGNGLLQVGEVLCGTVDWVDGCGPSGLSDGEEMVLDVRCWSGMERRRGWVRMVDRGVVVRFERRVRRVAPGQAVVLYCGEVCLGVGWVVEEQGLMERVGLTETSSSFPAKSIA